MQYKYVYNNELIAQIMKLYINIRVFRMKENITKIVTGTEQYLINNWKFLF